MGITDEVNLPVNVLPVSFPGLASHSQAFSAPDYLPKTFTRTLNQGSSTMSMDFHLIQQTLLLETEKDVDVEKAKETLYHPGDHAGQNKRKVVPREVVQALQQLAGVVFLLCK